MCGGGGRVGGGEEGVGQHMHYGNDARTTVFRESEQSVLGSTL